MAAYKRLLFRSTLKLDNNTILDIVGDSCKTSSDKAVTISEAELIRKYDLQKCPPAHTDHDHCDAPNIVVLCCQHGRKKDHLQSMFKCSKSSKATGSK